MQVSEYSFESPMVELTCVAQLADALSLLLPDSLLFPVLSTLPLPDPTNPTASSIHPMQTAVHNTLPIIEELVSLYEREEAETVDREVTKRRTRLGAAGPEQIRREVNCEVLESSRVRVLFLRSSMRVALMPEPHAATTPLRRDPKPS